MPSAGEHAAKDRGDFTRQHEPDENRRLPEHERRDHQVGNPAVQVDQAAGESAHCRRPSPRGGRPRALAAGPSPCQVLRVLVMI